MSQVAAISCSIVRQTAVTETRVRLASTGSDADPTTEMRQHVDLLAFCRLLCCLQTEEEKPTISSLCNERVN
jgi:hypothetical protein